MTTRLGTCQDYYNNTCRAVFLLWSPETTSRSALYGVLSWRSESDPFVHQTYADIFSLNTVQSPGVWTPGVEEDGKMHSSILVDREVSLSMATWETRFWCLVELMNNLAKIGNNRVRQSPS